MLGVNAGLVASWGALFVFTIAGWSDSDSGTGATTG
jgi:hypothetical protein